MAEKQTILGLGLKPVPMKLFATWEVDRTPPNCIPRLCNVTVTRLQVTAPLGGDLNSVTLAVKMQSSKRTLRSNEIPLPLQGSLDIELQLTFSLQYPHFLKREGNTLHVMLQRRKKYKNRTIMGFKTLAVGVINMSEVLQRPVDRELELYIDGKEKGISSIARVTMVALSSQPVDTDEVTDRHKPFLTDNPAVASLALLLSRGAAGFSTNFLEAHHPILPSRSMLGNTAEGLSPLRPLICLKHLTEPPTGGGINPLVDELAEVLPCLQWPPGADEQVHVPHNTTGVVNNQAMTDSILKTFYIPYLGCIKILITR